MKIRAKLTIGFPGADQEEEIDTVEDWGMEPDASDEEINKACADWASNYIEVWFERLDEDGEEQQ